MKTFCSCCERWSVLPLDGGMGESARAECEHCTAPLQVESHYFRCHSCGHYYLETRPATEVAGYTEQSPPSGTMTMEMFIVGSAQADFAPRSPRLQSPGVACPICHNASKVELIVDEIVVAYTTEAQMRKSRDGQYYTQLFMDYKLDAPSTPAPVHDPPLPAPIPTNGHAVGALPAGDGVEPSSISVNSNGSSNGHAGAATSKSGIDMAVTETVPFSLFPDELVQAYEADAGQVKVSSAGNYNDFEYELIQDPSRLAEVAEMLAREQAIGIDTETTGLDPHTSQLLLLQLSTADKVYVVDCKRLVPLALKSLLENNKILKVAQNAKFEYEMLKQQTGIVVSGVYDTMLAERVLTAGIARENSLKAIAQKYIGAVLDKSVRESFYKRAAIDDAYLAAEELHYAARDAYIMLPIWQQQKPELKKHKLEQIAELEFLCIAAVGDMELAGVKIDEASWRKIIADVQVQRDKAAIELNDILEPATMQATMFGVPSINLNSNTQLMEALSKLGVDLPDTMEATLVKFDHPAVKKLLEYRGHEKTLSAFGESVLGLINEKTGRIHPDFNQHGADTGRFSCTKPNVQQIPTTSDFRKCFVAPEGYKLVTCDYSQCELRILAELSGDEGFVTAFRSGGDLHALTASQMYGVPVEEVEKSQRSAAKAINFGLAYGMGPGGLAPRLGVSLDEAKGLIARYFKAYPGVQKWLEKAAKDGVRLGYSVTTLGRKRFYSAPDESLKTVDSDEYRRQLGAIERQAKNSPIQGGNADMTKLALINIRTALKGWDARIVNTVHDEIVVEVRTDQAEEIKHIVEHEMVRAGETILKSVPVVADASLADYWSK